MSDDNSNAQLQAMINAANAGWTAGTTSVSGLSTLEQSLRCGYVPDGDEMSLEQRSQISASRASAAGEGAIGVPAAYDWRNVGGQNYVTAIRDQKGCGSCVAFGTTAAVEAKARIQRSNPGLAIDLSEASLFFCIGPSTHASCGGGWYMQPAMDGYKNTGVPDESCFPYTDHDQACAQCSDWSARATKITGWHTLNSVADMKAWLSTNGPLATCFTVYNDFFSYKSGVYKHVTGGVAGGHCVCAIGYDDAAGCWICKNSWGTGWGDSGFFRIAYGQCGIDATMWAVEGVDETGWMSNVNVVGLWTIDQDRNAWAYISGYGWRKVAADNDNIFFDLLRLLAAAKEAKRPISAYQKSGVITQIYVL